MAGVLENIIVLDLAQNYAGPGVAMYLADQGATVYKVEPPGGDAARGWGPSPLLKGTGKGYLAVNRNKRSISVDLNLPEGRELVYDMVRKADVMIVNLRDAAAEKLGIDYQCLAAINPRLVYAAVSGYGNDGPYAGRPAYDSIIQGMSGALTFNPDGSPNRLGFFIADTSVPMLLAYGITLALLQRERTGRGQKVETSLLQAAIAMQSTAYVTLEGEGTPREADAQGGFIQCADGKYIIAAAHTERQFISMVTILGLDHILVSPEFLGEDRNVSTLMRKFRPEMRAAYLSRPSTEWLQEMGDADIPCGPVLTRPEVMQSEQVVINNMLEHMQYPDVGEITVLGLPLHLSDNPGGIHSRPPKLGEHTDEIAREFGLNDEQIAGLRARGVLR